MGNLWRVLLLANHLKSSLKNPNVAIFIIKSVSRSSWKVSTSVLRYVEDLALVHFAPSGRSGAFGLRSALRFAGLLTEEATVTACPYRYRYWWSGLVFVFLIQSRDAQCINTNCITSSTSKDILPQTPSGFKRIQRYEQFYRDSMDQCNLWTLDRIETFLLASCFLLLFLSLKWRFRTSSNRSQNWSVTFVT